MVDIPHLLGYNAKLQEVHSGGKDYCNLKHPRKGKVAVSAAVAGRKGTSTSPSTHFFCVDAAKL
jgi:hypothetical protein